MIVGATKRDFNPKVKAKIQLVKSKAEHGPRKDYVTREKGQRLERDANRLKALGECETLNEHIVLVTAVDLYQPVDMHPRTRPARRRHYCQNKRSTKAPNPESYRRNTVPCKSSRSHNVDRPKRHC